MTDDQNPDDAASPFAGLAEKIRGGKSASTQEYENRPPELTIKRGSDRNTGTGGKIGILVSVFGKIVSMSAYRVLIDGIEVGILNREETLTIQLAPGNHDIRLVTKLASSNSIVHQFEYGGRLKLFCQAKLSGIVLYK